MPKGRILSLEVGKISLSGSLILERYNPDELCVLSFTCRDGKSYETTLVGCWRRLNGVKYRFLQELNPFYFKVISYFCNFAKNKFIVSSSLNTPFSLWAVCFPITGHVIFSRKLFLYPSKNYLFIYTRLFENLKGRILKSTITWSEMGQQTAQSRKVY